MKRDPYKSVLWKNVFNKLDQNIQLWFILPFFFFFNPRVLLSTKPYPAKLLGHDTFPHCLHRLSFRAPPHPLPPDHHWTLGHRASPSPNHFSPSLAVRREWTVPDGCQNSLAFARDAGPFPQACRAPLPQRDAEPVVTVCVVRCLSCELSHS